MKIHHKISQFSHLWFCVIFLPLFFIVVACNKDEGGNSKKSASSVELKFEFESCPDHSADELLEMAEDVLAKDRAQFAGNYIAYFSCIGSKFLQSKHEYYDHEKNQKLHEYNARLAKLGKKLFDEEYRVYREPEVMDTLFSEAEKGDYTAIFQLFIIYAFDYSQYNIDNYYSLLDSFSDKITAASIVKDISSCYGIHFKQNSKFCAKLKKSHKFFSDLDEDNSEKVIIASKKSLFHLAILVLPSVRKINYQR